MINLEKPKEYDCYTKWREYYLSLDRNDFADEIDANGYCGLDVLIQYIHADDTFDGYIANNDGVCSMIDKETAEDILNNIEELTS